MNFLIFLFLSNWSADSLISDGYTSYPNQYNIACDDSGGVHTTWFKWNGAYRYSIWYKCYTESQWINEKRLSYGCLMSYPSITTSESDTLIYVVWQGHWGYSHIMLSKCWKGKWEDTLISVSSGVRYSYAPSAVCDSRGILHIVWEGGYEIHYRNFNGTNLSNDIVLSSSGVYAAYPSIAVFNDKIFLVWEDLRDGNFEVYFKEFDGTEWKDDKRVTNSVNASLFPSLCVDPVGVVHIVWQEDMVGGYKIFYTQYKNGEFVANTVIGDSPGEAVTPSIASSGDKIHLVWSDSRDGDWEIYYKNYDGSRWLGSERLTYANGISANPSISADSKGNLYVMFWDTRDDTAKVYFKEKKSSKNQSQITNYKLQISPNPAITEVNFVLQFCSAAVNSTIAQQHNRITIDIYDLAGRLVRLLPITDYRLPITVSWDGRDTNGVKLSSGIYFVRAQYLDCVKIIGQTPSAHTEVKKVILIR